MCLAVCFDTGIIIGVIFYVLLLGAVVLTPFVLAFVALVRWADARQRRMAAESPTLR